MSEPSGERRRVSFSDFDRVVETDEAATLLELARAHGVPLGSHCGGVCACSKCHVYVVEGREGLSPPDEDEVDMLDLAAKSREDRSRLACQAQLQPGAEVEVKLSEESFEQWLEDHPREREEALRRWLSRG